MFSVVSYCFVGEYWAVISEHQHQFRTSHCDKITAPWTVSHHYSIGAISKIVWPHFLFHLLMDRIQTAALPDYLLRWEFPCSVIPHITKFLCFSYLRCPFSVLCELHIPLVLLWHLLSTPCQMVYSFLLSKWRPIYSFLWPSQIFVWSFISGFVYFYKVGNHIAFLLQGSLASYRAPWNTLNRGPCFWHLHVSFFLNWYYDKYFPVLQDHFIFKRHEHFHCGLCFLKSLRFLQT